MDEMSDKSRERELYGVSSDMGDVVFCAVVTLVDHIFSRTTKYPTIVLFIALL